MGGPFFPAKMSLKPVNFRYLDLAKRLRVSMKDLDKEYDRVLVDLVGRLGFEVNPALYVVGAA